MWQIISNDFIISFFMYKCFIQWTIVYSTQGYIVLPLHNVSRGSSLIVWMLISRLIKQLEIVALIAAHLEIRNSDDHVETENSYDHFETENSIDCNYSLNPEWPV